MSDIEFRDIEFRAVGPPPGWKPPPKKKRIKKRKGRPIGSKNKTDLRWRVGNVSKIFRAKFESVCSYCQMPIREGMMVVYAKNEVVHTKCADKLIKEVADAVSKSKEADGYLF